MSNNILERLKEKRKKVQDLQNEELKRKGRLEQLKQDLKTEFGLDSLEAAFQHQQVIEEMLAKDGIELEKIESNLDKILEQNGD